MATVVDFSETLYLPKAAKRVPDKERPGCFKIEKGEHFFPSETAGFLVLEDLDGDGYGTVFLTNVVPGSVFETLIDDTEKNAVYALKVKLPTSCNLKEETLYYGWYLPLISVDGSAMTDKTFPMVQMFRTIGDFASVAAVFAKDVFVYLFEKYEDKFIGYLDKEEPSSDDFEVLGTRRGNVLDYLWVSSDLLTRRSVDVLACILKGHEGLVFMSFAGLFLESDIAVSTCEALRRAGRLYVPCAFPLEKKSETPGSVRRDTPCFWLQKLFGVINGGEPGPELSIDDCVAETLDVITSVVDAQDVPKTSVVSVFLPAPVFPCIPAIPYFVDTDVSELRLQKYVLWLFSEKPEGASFFRAGCTYIDTV